MLTLLASVYITAIIVVLRYLDIKSDQGAADEDKPNSSLGLARDAWPYSEKEFPCCVEDLDPDYTDESNNAPRDGIFYTHSFESIDSLLEIPFKSGYLPSIPQIEDSHHRIPHLELEHIHERENERNIKQKVFTSGTTRDPYEVLLLLSQGFNA